MYREEEIKQKGREGNVLRFALDAARNHLKKERGEKTHTHTHYTERGRRRGKGKGILSSGEVMRQEETVFSQGCHSSIRRTGGGGRGLRFLVRIPDFLKLARVIQNLGGGLIDCPEKDPNQGHEEYPWRNLFPETCHCQIDFDLF